MKKYVAKTNTSTFMVEADIGPNNYVWSCENLIEVDNNGNSDHVNNQSNPKGRWKGKP